MNTNDPPDRDARVRVAQIGACGAIQFLCDDLTLPPLYWNLPDVTGATVVAQAIGQVPGHLGDEAYRRQTLAAYAAHIGATPHEDEGGWLRAEGRYRGATVAIYTHVDEVGGEQQ